MLQGSLDTNEIRRQEARVNGGFSRSGLKYDDLKIGPGLLTERGRLRFSGWERKRKGRIQLPWYIEKARSRMQGYFVVSVSVLIVGDQADM